MKKLRIQFHTVSPWTRSGYGRICNEIGSRIAERHTVIVSCYYGLEPGGVINYKNMVCMPAKIGSFGSKSAIFINQTYGIDVSFLISDGWAFPWFPKRMRNPYFYGPMDSYNYGEEIINVFKPYKGIIAVSKFQKKEWSKYGLKIDYIPHGVNISIFKPMPKEKAREITKLSKDKFIIGSIGANSDKEPRKGWDRMAKGIKLFLQDNPDARKDTVWVIHSNVGDPRGVPIDRFIVKQGIQDNVILPNPMMSEVLLRDEQLAVLYNSFDILLHTSMREGFGLCILEALSCGIPVIATNTTSMVELVKGHGWLVDTALKGENMITLPINAESSVPDVYDIAKKLTEAYNKPDLLRRYSSASRKFALQYNWDDIINNMWLPYIEKIKEMLPLSSGEVFKKVMEG